MYPDLKLLYLQNVHILFPYREVLWLNQQKKIRFHPKGMKLTRFSTPTTSIKLTELIYEKMIQTITLIYQMNCVIRPTSSHSLTLMEAPAWRKLCWRGVERREKHLTDAKKTLRPGSLNTEKPLSATVYRNPLGQPLTSFYTYSFCPPSPNFTTQPLFHSCLLQF